MQNAEGQMIGLCNQCGISVAELQTVVKTSGENLLKYQLDSSSAIMSSILMITLIYKALTIQGEILC